jgi:hypothetical protein
MCVDMLLMFLLICIFLSNLWWQISVLVATGFVEMPKRDYSIIKTLLNILCYQLLDVNYVLINLQDLDRHFDRNIYSNGNNIAMSMRQYSDL